MFDQPDLKARFTLGISYPEDWRVVTNSLIKEGGGSISEPDFGHPEKSVTTSWVLFDETKPISTYVFAFAAGPWQEFSEAGVTGGNATVTERAPSKPAQASDTAGNSAATVEGTLPNGRVSARTDTSLSTHIYVRRSQAAKLQSNAAEIFKTARESNKYFDSKSAWPKHDLVLIPDLPSEVIQVPGITFVRESSIIHEK